MPTVALVVAVVSLSIGAIAAILLPFVAAVMHVSYALDAPVITAITGTLLGIITVILANRKNGNGNGQNSKQP